MRRASRARFTKRGKAISWGKKPPEVAAWFSAASQLQRDFNCTSKWSLSPRKRPWGSGSVPRHAARGGLAVAVRQWSHESGPGERCCHRRSEKQDCISPGLKVGSGSFAFHVRPSEVYTKHEAPSWMQSDPGSNHNKPPCEPVEWKYPERPSFAPCLMHLSKTSGPAREAGFAWSLSVGTFGS